MLICTFTRHMLVCRRLVFPVSLFPRWKLPQLKFSACSILQKNSQNRMSVQTSLPAWMQTGPPPYRGLFRGIASPVILCQLYAKYNGGYFACSSLVLYGIRAPKIGPFRAWKPSLCHIEPARSRGLWMPELVLYGIRLLAPASLGKLSTNESG